MTDAKLIDISGVLHHETHPGVPDEGAFLIDDGSGKKTWVPKRFVENNNDGTFTMPEWMAVEKGFV